MHRFLVVVQKLVVGNGSRSRSRFSARPCHVQAAIHDPESVRKVLGSLGLSAAVPELAGSRAPPGGGAGGEGGDDEGAAG